jgi:proton glutamate symport protein
MIKLKLHWQIIISLFLGIVFSKIFGPFSSFAEPIGDLFIRLLKMVTIPLVILSMITGVSNIGTTGRLGWLGIKTVCYYLSTSLLAILVGLSLVNWIRPGLSVDLTNKNLVSPLELPEPVPPLDLILRVIPTNPLAAAVNGDMLAIIFFSIAFGICVDRIGGDRKNRFAEILEDAFQAMMEMTRLVILIAPIGVFGLAVKLGNQNMGVDFFKAVGWYMTTIATGLTIHLFVILPFIYFFFTRQNPIRQFIGMSNALATVFATSSSLATLPVTMECVRKNLGVSKTVSGFVLPMGATVNMDGTALFECVGVIFIAQVMGVDLSFSQQSLIVFTALLASIGTAAIPSAGLVTIFIILETVGLKGEFVSIIVGAMLAADRPLDMYRGIVNIFSDSVGAVVIANSEGESLNVKSSEL